MQIPKSFILFGLALVAAAESAFESDLRPKLSPGATFSSTAPLRWSLYGAPEPSIVVNVATDRDVANSVKVANKYHLKFLAQGGGNGWADTFNLGEGGVIINLRGLNQITVNAQKTRARIGGGALVSETVAAASAAGVQVVTGNCNCVGTLGAALGGGYGYLIGLYGMGVDQIESLRVVLPDGDLTTITEQSNPDLFWALRGAGPNFGIVTSAVVKARAVPAAQNNAWTASAIFTNDKLEQLVTAIEGLQLTPESSIFMYFANGGPPNNDPILLTTFFVRGGDEEAGQEIFAPVLDLEPVFFQGQVVPYTQWNAGGDVFCARGQRKPSWGVGLDNLDPASWRAAWNEYVAFQQTPGAENSVTLLEVYDLRKAQSIPAASASFPHREVAFNAVIIAWYDDPALDATAVAYGNAARAALRSQDGLQPDATYINFANGDEPLRTIYGSSLQRLRAIKRAVDPRNRFDQWFPLLPRRSGSRF